MTSATLHLTAATRVEVGLLRSARLLTAFVERRVERRAERRRVALTLLREEQARRPDPSAVDHALAQLGLPRR